MKSSYRRNEWQVNKLKLNVSTIMAQLSINRTCNFTRTREPHEQWIERPTFATESRNGHKIGRFRTEN